MSASDITGKDVAQPTGCQGSCLGRPGPQLVHRWLGTSSQDELAVSLPLGTSGPRLWAGRYKQDALLVLAGRQGTSG